MHRDNMEGIEKAVPSVELSAKLISFINDALALEKNDKTDKEFQQYSTAKQGSSVPFQVVRRVFQTLKDAGMLSSCCDES